MTKVSFYSALIDFERQGRPEQVSAASSTLEAIFTTQNVSELAILLLRHFLILRRNDLESWEDTPEEWILEITGDVVSVESGFRVIHLKYESNPRLPGKPCSWNSCQSIRMT